jgi:hypothetical protein
VLAVRGIIRQYWAEAACGAGAFALFAATACRTVYVGDGGELIAAAQALGVAHPPGYPLWTILAKAALLVPLGEPAFRTTLLSAVLGALACTLAAHLARKWGEGSGLAALAAGTLLATGRTFWFSSTVTEVYTAHVLVALAALWAAERVRGASERAQLRRAILVLGVLVGVGLAHHPTIVLVLPTVALLVWRPRRPAKRGQGGLVAGIGVWLGAAALALGIAGLAYGSLLLRARWAPQATWNHFTAASVWLEHVTAAAYRPFDLGWGGLLRGDGWRVVLFTLGRDLGLVGVALAGVGVMVKTRPRVSLLVAVALHVVFALRYGTEDVAAYLLPALAALAILGGIGAARARTWQHRLVPAAVLLALAAQGAWRVPSLDLRKVTVGRDYVADVLDSVPDSGVLIADGDNIFLLQYATQVLRQRADLTLYDRGGHVLRALAPGVEQGLLARVQRGETALAFLSWPGYEAPGGFRFRPHGLVFFLERDDAPVPPDRAFWESARQDSVTRQALRSRDLLARTLAASYPIQRGERALFENDATRAEALFQEARVLAGDSETVRNTLGTIYGRRGDLSKAAAEFEEALRLKPASPRAAANLRMVRQLAGR